MKKRALKAALIFSLVVVATAIYNQVKVERYKLLLKSEYGFYVEKSRLSYKPFVIFYLESKLWKQETHQVYWNSIYKPYNEMGLFDKEQSNVLFNIEYNAYLMYCFHRSELDPS